VGISKPAFFISRKVRKVKNKIRGDAEAQRNFCDPASLRLIVANNCNKLHYVLFLQQKTIMPTAVRISDELIKSAKKVSKVENRSLTGQIEYWAKIGQIAEENPDMSYKLIKEILLGLKDLESGEFSDYHLNEP